MDEAEVIFLMSMLGISHGEYSVVSMTTITITLAKVIPIFKVSAYVQLQS